MSKSSVSLTNMDWTAVVLAGGESRRFGQNKAQAVFNGRRLIDHAVSCALALSNRALVISGKQIADLPSSVSQYPDRLSGKGPLGGIHAALYYADTPWVAILPVDMPFLQPRVYRFLASFADRAKVVVAKSEKGLEPMVSLWAKETMSEVNDCLQNNRLSIHRFLRDLPATEVDFPAEYPEYRPEIFANINTRADFERLTKLTETDI